MNGSTVVNSSGRALALTGQIGSSLPGSSATITGSTLSGAGIGASVQLGGNLTLDASRLEGHAQGATGVSSGTGLFLVGSGQITARNGSTIIGEGNGIWAQYDFTPVAGDAVTVDIDASRVEGRAGSGIYIEEKFDAADAAVVARFNFRNGAELVGGDGNLLRVDATDANIALNVDNSRMTGNVVNAGGSTVNVALSNGAVLNGAMTNVTSATLDSATWNMTGNSTVGTLNLGNGTVSLGDGSAFHTLNVAGNFTGNGGTLAFNTVLAGDDAATDKLIIGGDTSGTANVRVNNVGGAVQPGRPCRRWPVRVLPVQGHRC
ncbi:hypothetical protein G6F68_011028 [Rhizopus microsporus]|nr:hypothetical protein G6F68_011028 [Rhizopus microsporus]